MVDQKHLECTNTHLVIGEIQIIAIRNEGLLGDGQLDWERINGVGISGLNRYYGLQFLNQFEYARVEDLPVW